MVKANEQKREIFDFFKDNADKLFDDSELVQSAKELVALFGKVIRGYRLYPRSNPAFSKFADMFKAKLDDILKDLASISLRISTKGFMLGNHVLDTGEKDKEVVFFLYNDGLREMFFQKGTTKEEVTQLFDILAQCTLFASDDYDLSTLLWDHNFTNIGYITEDELIKQNLSADDSENSFSPFLVEELSYGPGFDGIGSVDEDDGKEGGSVNSPTEMATATKFEVSDFERYTDLILKENIDIDMNERKELLSKRLSNYIVGKMEMFKFDEALKKNSDSFVVSRFLKELSARLISSQGTEAGKELLETASSLWEKLLLFGSVSGAILFIKTLNTIAAKLENVQPEYSKKIRESFADLENEDFLNDFFFTIEDIPMQEIEVIGELFAMIPSKKMDFLLGKINSIEAKETRIAVIHSCAKYIPISDELIALTRHADWKVVRNALAIMKEKNDPRIVPAIRALVSHPQKQARIEALALLMEFSIEEALPALERAVFSTARDVRDPAIRKVLELKDNSIKPIINRVLLVHNLKKLDSEEIEEIFELIISMRRYDLFDLLGQQLLTEDKDIREKAIMAILKATTMTHFSKFIARAANTATITKMSPDELHKFCVLFKPEIFGELLPALKPLLYESGTLFNKSVPNAKEAVFSALFTNRNDSAVKDFINLALNSGNKETVKIVNKIKDKYL